MRLLLLLFPSATHTGSSTPDTTTHKRLYNHHSVLRVRLCVCVRVCVGWRVFDRVFDRVYMCSCGRVCVAPPPGGGWGGASASARVCGSTTSREGCRRSGVGGRSNWLALARRGLPCSSTLSSPVPANPTERLRAGDGDGDSRLGLRLGCSSSVGSENPTERLRTGDGDDESE